MPPPRTWRPVDAYLSDQIFKSKGPDSLPVGSGFVQGSGGALGATTNRKRARQRGQFAALVEVARYEISWDLKKFWVYFSAFILVLLAILSGFLLPFDLTHPGGPPIGVGNTTGSASTTVVTFEETGLAPGTPWTVSIEEHSPFWSTSTGRSITFHVPSGTFGYDVGSLQRSETGYVSGSPRGSIATRGIPVTIQIPFHRVSPSSPMDFSDAEALAITAANSMGGHWVPVRVEGANWKAPVVNHTVPNNGLCLLRGGTGSWPVNPPWTGDYASGRMSTWYFEFWEPALDSEDFIVVEGGVASNVGYVVGNLCVGPVAPYAVPDPPPVNITDVARALVPYEHAFIVSHPEADARFELTSRGGTPVWLAELALCSTMRGGMSPGFLAAMDARTGRILVAANSTVTCPDLGPVSHALPLSGLLASPSSNPSQGNTTTPLPRQFTSTWWEDAVLMMYIFGFWFIIIGGVSSSESVAREKDKGTLWALVSQPARRETIFLGKFLAKVAIFLPLSALYVGLVIILSWLTMGPQTNLQWAPLAILELSLSFLSFAAIALCLSVLFRRSRPASLLLWLIGGASEGFLIWLKNTTSLPRVPLAYLLPGENAWLPFAGLRVYAANPNGMAYVTFLPQSLIPMYPVTAQLAAGFVSTASFALLSAVGLLLTTLLFVVLGLVLFRRLEVPE